MHKVRINVSFLSEVNFNLFLKLPRMGEMRNSYSILVGKSEGKRPLARRRLRWEDNIRRGLRETGWEVADWIRVA
jgi:hypothetical protein